MCNFWSAIIDRTGKVYHLGEIISHEKIIEKFKLKDSEAGHICRIEIPVLDGVNFRLEKDWIVKVDQSETPSWLTEEMKQCALKTFCSWNETVFQKKWKRFKKLNEPNEKLVKMKGEEIIWREKLLPAHKKLIVRFYLRGEKTSWVSMRDSVWDSVRGSAWGSVRVSKKPYPLALPKKIFDLGYIHCLIKEEDDVTRIHVYGKKGMLLKKIDFKDKNGKIIKRGN